MIKAARGSYFPEVSLQAGSDVRHRDLGGTKPEWISGVFMEYPFFEGGLTKAQVAKASSQSLQLLEKKRDRLNGLKVDLTAAWKDQENARQGVATTRQTVATNEEAYASAQALYRYGKAIGLDVLQAQVDLTSFPVPAISDMPWPMKSARPASNKLPAPTHRSLVQPNDRRGAEDSEITWRKEGDRGCHRGSLSSFCWATV